MRGDEVGLFWEEAPRVRRGDLLADRPLPPIPETDWVMPTNYPSLQGQGYISIDCETYDPDLSTLGPGYNRDGRIVGVAVGTQAGFRGYYPVDHAIGGNLPRAVVMAWLARELATPIPKVGANLLYDLGYLEAAGVRVAGPFYDVQVAEPLLDETRLSYALEVLARYYLGEGKKDSVMSRWLAQAFGPAEKQIKGNIWRAPASLVGPYAEGDVDLPLRIFEQQETELHALGLWDLFVLESKLIPMLLAMRQRGVCVDIGRAEELYAVLERRQGEAMEQLRGRVGFDIDIWAAESIAKMFDEIGIAYPRTEKTQAPSFRKGWLESCPDPAARLLVDARRMDKFKGTFVKGYILDGSQNGRIHCQFHQLRGDEGGTVSGRLSSSTPNMQNLPIRDPELGPLIRSIFVAEQEQRWWKFDWSQIEFRLAVHYAGLMKLRGIQAVIDQYHQDDTTDYHQVVAAMTGLPRSQAKSINFGLIYGMGVPTLCYQLGVERDEGERLLWQYHDQVPFVKPLYQEASSRAYNKGQIITIEGRRRRFNVWERHGQYHNGEQPDHTWQRAFTHKALNSLLQGSAADIMKKGMVQIWESGVCDVLGAPHLTVHDELDGSVVPDKQGLEALQHVKRIMETCVELLIPLKADGGQLGANWNEAK